MYIFNKKIKKCDKRLMRVNNFNWRCRMKKAKLFFFGSIIMAAFLVSLNINTTSAVTVGVSVFLDNMFSQEESNTVYKTTFSEQYFETLSVYKNRTAYVALFTADNSGGSTSYEWNKICYENQLRNIEFYHNLQKQADTNYKLRFKTSGVYIGGTGITGIWTYDK